MPVRHLLVWLAAGAACWSLIATAAFLAPQALLAVAALLALPLLRRARSAPAMGVAHPVLLRTAADEATTGVTGVVGARDDERVLVARSA
jgi:hypothetical protein